MKLIRLFIPVVLGICLLIPFTGFSGNEVTTRTHKTPEFTKIEAGGVFKISFRVGPLAPIIIEAEDFAHEKIEVSVHSGLLKLSCNNLRNMDHDIKVTIVAPALESIDMSGASAFATIGTLKAGSFSIEASGASEVLVNVEAANTKIDVSGAAKLTLKGDSKQMNVEVSGAGKLYAESFVSANSDVDVSGAGYAEVNVTQNLEAEASGAGSIRYHGNARVRSHTSGAGSIHQNN
ncbi:MAG TPA: hypothetical protein DEO70_11955 [Bacteroidales bacterium]|nr:MAG: hypothetical protein A2X11_09945 [Bacteroidetes bacterium GWE2_42_24]OFY26183.1 MAG: hypothetical protein A2X09_05195 [Bacteroidetes bacterium GWF2_43_11]PKP23376.1 MAG: hypothetical protein CVU06_08580 [Bacteroidetes bacterium HGW-Bacteroidetes-22]HBZ67541.1 hypothetical protein [Bacteroidales bacterium]